MLCSFQRQALNIFTICNKRTTESYYFCCLAIFYYFVYLNKYWNWCNITTTGFINSFINYFFQSLKVDILLMGSVNCLNKIQIRYWVWYGVKSSIFYPYLKTCYYTYLKVRYPFVQKRLELYTGEATIYNFVMIGFNKLYQKDMTVLSQIWLFALKYLTHLKNFDLPSQWNPIALRLWK